MSIEDQVLALIEEGNPIPDPETIESLPAEPAAYLATLQRRSSEVVQLEEKTQGEGRKNRWWLTMAAAVVVVLGLVVLLLTQGDDEAPVATQPPVETGTIEGYWTGTEADFYFGESEYAIVINGALSDSGTYEAGAREADNRIVTLTSGQETVDCRPGDVAIINYDFLDGETVQLSATPTDDCGPRPLLDVEILTPADPFEVPGSGGVPSSRIDLVGTWSQGATAFVFDESTYAIVQNDILVDEGTHELEGEPPMVTYTSSTRSAGCAPGSTGRMMVAVENGLSLVADSDQCLVRSFLAAGGPLLELSRADDVDTGVFETLIDISGEWSSDSVGASFTNGNYEFSTDGEVIDSGSYTFTTGPYRVELQSSSQDPNCSSATYDVALEGGADLILRSANESCPVRAAFTDVFLTRTDVEG